MALSRGMIGTQGKNPKCLPFHKKTFSLETGECLVVMSALLKPIAVKVEDGNVFIGIYADLELESADENFT